MDDIVALMRSWALASVCALLTVMAPLRAFGAGAEVEKATKDQLAAAATTFEAANKLFDAGRFEEAITAFRASYDIVRSPNSVLMVARCQRELGRLGEAYANYKSALADAERIAKTVPKYDDTTQAAREELASLRSQVALLTVSVSGAQDDSEVRVADQKIPVAQLSEPIALKPGEYDVSARSASGQLVTKHISLAAGAEQSVALDLSATPAPQAAATTAPAPTDTTTVKASASGSHALAYVAGGVGVVGLAAFGVFGSMANSKYDSLDSKCPGGTCPPGTQNDIDKGKQYQLFANVGLVVGVVGVGAGITLFALGGGSSHERSASTGHSELAVVPGGVSWRGRF